MFFLLLKKAFFDAWDNLGALIVGNLTMFLLVTAGLWPMFRFLESGSVAGLLFPVILLPFLIVAAGVIATAMSQVADYHRPSWSEIPALIRTRWKSALAGGALSTGFFAVSFFGMGYYARLQGLLGLAASALLFWITLGFYLTMIWYLPVRNRLDGGFRKALKKCALIMLDNMGLSLYLGLIVIPLQMLLWPLTAFGAFGPAGVLLYLNGALRLLMFKYDWLEAHPDARRKDIPWEELLLDERERVGKRTLKGMIFPWKE